MAPPVAAALDRGDDFNWDEQLSPADTPDAGHVQGAGRAQEGELSPGTGQGGYALATAIHISNCRTGTTVYTRR